jgi:hypothetical protein
MKEDLKLYSSLMLRPLMRMYYAGFAFGVPVTFALLWHRGELKLDGIPVLLGATLVLVFLIFWFFPYLHQRRLCSQPNLLNTPVMLFICDETLRTELPDSQTECRWESFRSFREERNAFVLYTTKTAFQILPKRWLTDEQIKQLRDFLPSVIHGRMARVN